MCIRCGARDAVWPDDLCGPCGFYTRIEVSRGLRRLSDYLGAWAAFEEWERAQPQEPRAGPVVA
jgi:hypothetical protein